jgi:hypothetical protein
MRMLATHFSAHRKRVLIFNCGFCNGCITKRCLNNNLVRKCSMIKDESNQVNVFCHARNNIFFYNIGFFLMKGAHKSISIMRRTCFRIHRYVAVFNLPDTAGLTLFL